MLGALAAVSVGVGALFWSGRSDRAATPADQARALERYSSAIAEPTRLAGKAIIAGIRPDITDFRSGRISPAVWMDDMQTRAVEFSQAWRGIASADAPAEVAAALPAFDEAFRTYLLATHVFYAAGKTDGDGREQLIELGAQLGDAGDQAFDRGARTIQQARIAAGLLPDPHLPHPEQP